jgi:hypothetical protein
VGCCSPPIRIKEVAVMATAGFGATFARADLVDDLVALAGEAGVRLILLTGPAGVGKSFILDAVADRIGADRAWGTPGLAEVPGSALAHLVEPQDSVPQMIRSVLVGVGKLLCVDDLDTCDPLSQSLIERLVREPDRTVVATIRTGLGQEGVGPVPQIVASVAGEPWTRRIEIPPLGREESDSLVKKILGAAVDAQVTEAVWRQARGNASNTETIVREALAPGATSRSPISLANGRWTLIGSLPTPTGLADAIAGQVRGLGEDALEAAQWLAGAGVAPLARAESSGRGETLRLLEAAGIVRFDSRAHGSSKQAAFRASGGASVGEAKLPSFISASRAPCGASVGEAKLRISTSAAQSHQVPP